MYINLSKTLRTIEGCLPGDGAADLPALKRAYQQTLRLQSQLLSAVYDAETFGGLASGEPFAKEQSAGANCGASVTLTISEPLPAMKWLTEAIEEHWKAMLHAAIEEAARQSPLPYFEKAFVEIGISTPKGSDNARLWDTSNRAINVVINNLKGIFFEDDNMEHMAFSVVANWGEKGATTIRISELEQVAGGYFGLKGPLPHEF